jgi:3-oxoacyl-[acyl-carrier-protein] synthase II
MNDARRIAITGLGAVSPFGLGVPLFWDSILAGKSAVRPIEGFDATVFRSGLGAEVPRAIYQDEALRARAGNPEEDATFFSMLAAREALEDAGLAGASNSDNRIGCVIGTLCSGARNLEKYGRAFMFDQGSRPPSGESPESIVVSYQLDFLTRALNLGGPSALISTACASTTDAIGHAADLIRNGDCERVLVGGGDVIGEVVHGGFNSVFSITPTQPKPFDRSRDGFVIGEGAGMMVLETLDAARARGARIYGEVCGYGLSNTAFHLTATSDDGSGESLAVRRALEDAGISADKVDYVNSHGTATAHNDATEARALASIFGACERKVLVNSIKPMIGHCMGAAGIFEAICTVLAVYDGIVPPTLNSAGDEEGPGFQLVTGTAVQHKLRYAISESFGFGGACSCVVIGAPNLAS